MIEHQPENSAEQTRQTEPIPAPPVPPPADPLPPEQRRTLIGSGAVQFYVHRFLFGFCAHPILPLVLLALVALALGLGEGFGVTDLIYHENKWQQMLGGFVLAYVVVACAYAGFLFDTRLYPLDPDGGHWYDVPHWGFWRYCAGIVASFGFTLVLAGAVYGLILGGLALAGDVSGEDKGSNPFGLFFDDRIQWWWLPLGGLVGFASAVALGTLTYRFWEWASPRVLGTEDRPSLVAGATGSALQAALPPAEPERRRRRYLRPLWLGGREYPAWWLAVWLLGVFLVAHLLSCAAVAGFGAPGWVGPATTAGLVGLACWWRHRQLVGLWLSARAGLGPRDETGLDRYHYRGAGALFVVFALLLFGLADNITNVFGGTARDFGEPTPVALFGAAIFVLLSIYTGLTIAYRRAVPVIVLGGFVLLVFAGIPPYKFRFPGLEYRPKDVILNLGDQATREAAAWEKHQMDLKALIDRGLDPIKQREQFDQIRQAITGTGYRLIPAPTPNWPRARSWAATDWKDERDRWRRPDEVTVPYYRLPYTALNKKPEAVGYPRTGADKKPLFIISVSGGGHAAAVWTLGVLNRLERAFAEEGIDFPAHVLLLTGASGGMMGAAYYVTSLPEHGPGPARDEFLWTVQHARAPCEECVGGRLGEDVQHLLGEDFLTPLVNRMLFNDVPAYFSPFPNYRDRGRRLEERWEEWILNERGRRERQEQSRRADLKRPPLAPGRADPADDKSPFALTFADLKRRELSGRYPFLVFAPMMIEDGRRLLISNMDLASVASNDGNGLDRTTAGPGSRFREGLNYNYSRGELELFRLFPEQHDSFRLSTAVRMSASFPFFSPAVSLPTKPRRRVVDAGYYDNYGICVAASWLFSTSHQEWMDAHVSKVAIIQIRASRSEKSRRLEEVPAPEDHMLSRAMEELLSPVEGLNQARVGSASFRNDGQLELLSKWFRATQDRGERLPHIDRYFTTVTFELDSDVTLSWYLGRKDRATIKEALTPHADWVEWLRTRPAGKGSQTPAPPENLARTALDEKIDYLLRWYWRERPERTQPKK